MTSRYPWPGLAGSTALFLLLALEPAVGEKVRFGASRWTDVPTRPERTMSERIEARSDMELGRPEMSRAALPAAAPVAASTRLSREDEADRQNWIFRDTRSAAGVRKAFGVESGVASAPSIAERDSATVIQEYFDRQRPRAAATPSELTPRAEQSGLGGARNPAGSTFAAPADGFGDGGNVKSGNLFGESAFRNTLNSDNTAVRRYFRELYVNPSSSMTPGLVPTPAATAGTGGSLTGTAPPPGAASTRPPSFQELAERAAFIDSLTPAASLGNGLGSPAPNNAPVPGSPGMPTQNNGKLFEKRNGLIEIPSRRF